MRKSIAIIVLALLGVAGCAGAVPAASGTDLPAPRAGCTCPEGYVQEGEACNPQCYYGTPPCLAPSLRCVAEGAGAP